MIPAACQPSQILDEDLIGNDKVSRLLAAKLSFGISQAKYALVDGASHNARLGE